jgi:hypothetical protein
MGGTFTESLGKRLSGDSAFVRSVSGAWRWFQFSRGFAKIAEKGA